jgi:DNA-binding GntR family transcriptional regulator
MTCPCRTRVGYQLDRLQKEARARSGVLGERVEAFQEGIRSGAEAIALRRLFRAGVYWASLDHDLARNPSHNQILSSLSTHIAVDRPDLNHLVARVRELAQSGGVVDDPREMLKKILRTKGPKASSLLQANATNELDRCDAALRQAERLRERLAVWREGIAGCQNPEVVCIVDLHDASGDPATSPPR